MDRLIDSDQPIDVFVIRWNKHGKVSSEEQHSVAANKAHDFCATMAQTLAASVEGAGEVLENDYAHYEVWNASGSRKLYDVREIN